MTLFKQAEKEEEGRNIEDEVKMTTEVSVCHFLVVVQVSIVKFKNHDSPVMLANREMSSLYNEKGQVSEYDNITLLFNNIIFSCLKIK